MRITPLRMSSQIGSAAGICPRSLHTLTTSPADRPRARASPEHHPFAVLGEALSGGVLAIHLDRAGRSDFGWLYWFDEYWSQL